MAIDTNLQVFTDAELLLLTRNAIAQILVSGQSYGINGRNLTRVDLPKLWETVHELEARINVADNTGGGVVLGSFGGPY